MISYVLILRGINVGGNRRLLMADLKALLSKLQFENVQTYIQSGNVAFQSTEKLNIAEIETLITKKIRDQFGFEVPVILFGLKKLENIIEENPFSDSSQIEKLYCTFIKNEPHYLSVNNLLKLSFEPDIFKVSKDVIYIKFESKASNSKISNGLFEKQLNEICTTRNWKTTLKLLDLAKGL